MPSLSTIKSQPLRWLWPNHFPLGKLSLLVAEQGAGKSFLALDIAARVSLGASWPTHPGESNEAGSVLLLAADDLADIACPRLEAAGANLKLISTPEAAQPPDGSGDHEEAHDQEAPPFDITALEQEIKSIPHCRLVIIDPLTEFLPPAKNRKRPDWPSIFKTLAAIAARTGVAIIALMSFIPSTSAAANHRAVATIASYAGPACVWRIAFDPEHEARRSLIPIKNNLAPRNAPLPFALQSTDETNPANITWQPAQQESTSSPIRVSLAPPVPSRESDVAPLEPAKQSPAPSLPAPASHDQEQESAIAKTTNWLVSYLNSCSGQLRASTIRHNADFRRIPDHILTLAKHRANIQTLPTAAPDDELWKLP